MGKRTNWLYNKGQDYIENNNLIYYFFHSNLRVFRRETTLSEFTQQGL